MSLPFQIEYRCSACAFRFGPVRPRPVSPGQKERPCYVYCVACGTAVELWGDPAALAFRCAACQGDRHHWLDDCPKCHAPIAQKMVP